MWNQREVDRHYESPFKQVYLSYELFKSPFCLMNFRWEVICFLLTSNELAWRKRMQTLFSDMKNNNVCSNNHLPLIWRQLTVSVSYVHPPWMLFTAFCSSWLAWTKKYIYTFWFSLWTAAVTLTNRHRVWGKMISCAEELKLLTIHFYIFLLYLQHSSCFYFPHYLTQIKGKKVWI